jgi:hypothetical protein
MIRRIAIMHETFVTTELESEVQATILDFLRAQNNLVVIKVIVATTNGTADILVCYMGRFIAIEVKRDMNSKPDPLQVAFLNDVIDAGGQAIVTSSVKDVQLILEYDIFGKEKFEYNIADFTEAL